MIPITPAAQPTNDLREITIPDDVADIFDEASIPGGDLSAAFGPNSVKLVNSKTGQVIRETQWADTAEYARRVLEASLATTVIAAPTASPQPSLSNETVEKMVEAYQDREMAKVSEKVERLKQAIQSVIEKDSP